MKRSLSLVAGLLILLGGFWALDIPFADLLDHIGRVQMIYILLMVVLLIFNLVVVAHRWSLMVRSVLPSATFPRGFFSFSTIAAAFSSYILPHSAGNIGVKVVALKTIGKVDWKHGLLLAVVEHGLNLAFAALMIIPALAYLYHLEPRELYLTLGFFLAATPFALFLRYQTVLLSWFLSERHRPHRLIRKLSGKLADQLSRKETGDIFSDFIRNKGFEKIFFHSALIYFIPTLRFYCIILSLDINLSFLLFFISFPIVHLLTILSPTPSGLGVQEMGWVGVLVFHGIDKELALSFAISLRIFDQLTMILISFISYWFFLRLGFVDALKKPSDSDR